MPRATGKTKTNRSTIFEHWGRSGWNGATWWLSGSVLGQAKRSLATASAFERYRMAHGRLTSTLEDLVPAFPPSIPTDPLTGKPRCYKPSESSSYLIYGTG